MQGSIEPCIYSRYIEPCMYFRLRCWLPARHLLSSHAGRETVALGILTLEEDWRIHTHRWEMPPLPAFGASAHQPTGGNWNGHSKLQTCSRVAWCSAPATAAAASSCGAIGNTSGGSSRSRRGSSGSRRGGPGWISAAAARPSHEQPSAAQHASGRQRRRRRREDLPFFIARSDLTWNPPWCFEQSAALSELQLRQQGVSGLDGAAAAAPECHATATFQVELPAGLGALVVRGTVAADVPLRCEMCSEPFQASLDGVAFDAVVLLEAGGASGRDEQREADLDEMVFNLNENLCDITPLVSDAIVSSLPSVCLCGGGSCRQHEGREVVWRSTSSTAPSPATSLFGKLLAKQEKQQRQRQEGEEETAGAAAAEGEEVAAGAAAVQEVVAFCNASY